ncbi:hypothetical protein LXL04_035239 [Taraxacum kok-saghyz]
MHLGRLAIVLGFLSGGLRFESWGDASGFTPVVRGFLRIGGLLFGVTKVVVTAGGAIAVLTDPPSTNLTPPVPKKKRLAMRPCITRGILSTPENHFSLVNNGKVKKRRSVVVSIAPILNIQKCGSNKDKRGSCISVYNHAFAFPELVAIPATKRGNGG